jgi:periplasmic protein TonB
MGYQALLFCPDEKTARTVTQVLSELDFTVTPCTEPFAAVKKLMGEHFDAVVVDCDNEQNATLLFKSARNTSTNQSSLAVAVVEGQAGVAKAFRIGANLVLTKPINVEQAKGTLRVARGLLRKNEAAKPAPVAISAASAPASPKSSPQAIPSSVDAELTQPPTIPLVNAATASVQSQKPASVMNAVPASTADSAEPAIAPTTDRSVSQALAKLHAAHTQASQTGSSSDPKIEVTGSRAAFGMGAASAPAPARDLKAGVPIERKSSTVLPEAKSTAKVEALRESTASTTESSAPAMFTFGGTVSSSTESDGSGSKKLLLAIAAAVVIIAAGGYAAWMHWGQSTESSAITDHVVETPEKTPAAIQQAARPDHAPPVKSSAPDTQTSVSGSDEPKHAGKASTSADSLKPSAETIAPSKAPETKQASEPLVIRNSSSRTAPKSLANNNSDVPIAPSMAAIAPAGNGGGLPNLMDSQSKAPTPVLQTLSVSQGVSQGLLLKKVQPKYPPNSLRLRVEGGVQLMATISKTGDISAVKILSGDPQLSHAAVDAVKQWKYKPYLLNGLPVEIQTQVTVNFKLPN